jgi:hypothetical protein
MKRYISLFQESRSLLIEFTWVDIDRKQLEDEWKTENIDSLFFNGYPSSSELAQYKKVFFDNFRKFSSIELISDVSGLHTYIQKDLDEVKRAIAYMRKDVDYLIAQMQSESGKLSYPLLMRKNNQLQVIGGRTRLTIAYMLKIPIKARVIDYKRMMSYFHDLRAEKFLTIGFDILAMDSDEQRLSIYNFLMGKSDHIEDYGGIWGEMNTKQRQDLLSDLSNFLGL